LGFRPRSIGGSLIDVDGARIFDLRIQGIVTGNTNHCRVCINRHCAAKAITGVRSPNDLLFALKRRGLSVCQGRERREEDGRKDEEPDEAIDDVKGAERRSRLDVIEGGETDVRPSERVENHDFGHSDTKRI
jgi:hypothetical protein